MAGDRATPAAGAASRASTGSPVPARTPAAARTTDLAGLFGSGPVLLPVTGFWSWALLDRQGGRLYGDRLTDTTTTASMIKAWLVADYLHRIAAGGSAPADNRLAELSRMIRDSDNTIAEVIFRELGGTDSIRRLIDRCGLTDSGPTDRYWSLTVMSARDTARMGACLADGRAAGPRWTGWLLTEMRHVRGFGEFGIRPVLPPDVAAETAIKNGWIRRDDGLWYVNCLAIVGDRWVLAVLTRYDATLGVGYGSGVCSAVTSQLLAAH